MSENLILQEECRPLAEYAWLVNEVRKAKNEEELEGIIDAAITAMPADYVIKPFLEEHRAEVKGMLLTEYDEVATMELFKAEGRAEGRAEGALGMLVNLVKKGRMTPAKEMHSHGFTDGNRLLVAQSLTRKRVGLFIVDDLFLVPQIVKANL